VLQVKLLKRGKTLFQYSIHVNVRRKVAADSDETTLEPLHPRPGKRQDNKTQVSTISVEK
jgi:hypothetical protein